MEASRLRPLVEPELDTSELLSRLERHAAESGRLAGRVETLEQALQKEREARRRLTDTLRRERSAAKLLHDRAEQAEAASAAVEEELARLREAVAFSEQQTQLSWAQLTSTERELAWTARPLWRKLFGRPPRGS